MKVVKKRKVIKIDTSESEDEEENVTIHQKQTSGTATKNTIPSSVSNLLACRVCLSTDGKLFNLYECKMDEVFSDFTGMPMFQLDGLPHYLCYLCLGLLRKSSDFRDKCLSTHFYLRNIYMKTSQLTERDISLLDKKKFALPLKETLPLTIDYCAETNMEVEQQLSDNEDFNVEYLDDIDIDLKPNPKTLPESVDIPKKAHKYFLVVNEKGNIAVGPDVEADANENAENNMSLDNAETFTDDDIYDETYEKPIVDEKEVANSSASVSIEDTIRRAGFGSKEELETFCVKYNVSVVQGAEVELEEMERIRNSETFKNSDYKCELCCKIYKCAKSYANHKERHDMNSKLECEICRLRFNFKKKLRAHILTIHKRVMFKCISCGWFSRNSYNAKGHSDSHKQKFKKIFHCTECPKIFSLYGLLNLHVEQNHASRLCSQCGESFEGTKAFLEHNTIVHNQPHKCSLCNMSFETSNALDHHQCNYRKCRTCEEGFESETQMKTHHMESHQTRKCKECEFTCEYFTTLRQHYKSEHKDVKPPSVKPFVYVRPCKICDKLLNSTSFKTHMLTHSGEKSHQCRFCGKRYLQQKHLREHEFKHTGEKPHKCPDCPATFRTYMEKTEHKKAVHLEEKYRCRICHRYYASQSNLKLHEVNHLYGGYYKCKLCLRQFTLKSTLERHLANHPSTKGNNNKKKCKIAVKSLRCNLCPLRFASQFSVEKHKAEVHNIIESYQCDKCGKVYQHKTTLATHLRNRHLDEKFKCTLCPKEFVTKGVLMEHMNMHTGAKPFHCSLCPKTFSRHWMRYEHMRRDHLMKPVRRTRPVTQTTDFDDEQN